MLAKILRTISVLQENGPSLREPYSKSLGDGIFELRAKVRSDISRVLYFFFYLYIRTYDELQDNEKYLEAFGLCYDLLFQYVNNTKDKMISIVDPDARVAHKTPTKSKTGYKDHNSEKWKIAKQRQKA